MVDDVDEEIRTGEVARNEKSHTHDDLSRGCFHQVFTLDQSCPRSVELAITAHMEWREFHGVTLAK